MDDENESVPEPTSPGNEPTIPVGATGGGEPVAADPTAGEPVGATGGGEPVAANPTAAAPSTGGGRVGRILRATVSIILCVLGVICLVLAPITIWGRNLLLDTNRYVETVTPLADSPAVQAAVVTAVTKKVDENIDTSKILSQALPPKAVKVLAGPTQSATNLLVATITTKFVESAAFHKLWVSTNRAAHEQIVAVLTGKDLVNGDVKIKAGNITVDLSQVVQNVKARLVAAGITAASQIPPIGTTLQIANVKGLDQAQTATRFFDKIADWLPLIGIALTAAGVYLARRRRRAVIASALGLAAGMVVIGVGLAIGRQIYLTDIPADALPRATAEEIFNTIVRFLRDGLRAIFVLALLTAGAVWVTGPSRSAVGVRGGVTRVTQRFGNDHVRSGPVSEFVARYTALFRVGIVALAGLILVIIDHPTAWDIAILAVLLVVGLLLVELIRAPAVHRSAEGAP